MGQKGELQQTPRGPHSPIPFPSHPLLKGPTSRRRRWIMKLLPKWPESFATSLGAGTEVGHTAPGSSLTLPNCPWYSGHERGGQGRLFPALETEVPMVSVPNHCIWRSLNCLRNLSPTLELCGQGHPLFQNSWGEENINIPCHHYKWKGERCQQPLSSVSPSAVQEPFALECLWSADSWASRILIFSELFRDSGATKIQKPPFP